MSLFIQLPKWPLDAAVIEELRALPIQPGSWAGLRQGHNTYGRENTVEVCAWVDIENNVVRASCAVLQGRERHALAGLLVQAMRHPDGGAAPVRPQSVEIDPVHKDVRTLAEALGCEAVENEYAFDADTLLEDELEQVHGCRRGVNYLLRDKMEPLLVKRLFEVAADCWNGGLWRSLEPDTVIRVDGLGKSPVYACIIPRGLVICGSDKSLKSYFKGSREGALCHNRYLVLRMARPHEAGSRLLDEIRRSGWPVAAPDAIPVLNLSDRRVGMLATDAEMERGIDVLHAVLASLQGRTEGEVKLPSGAKARISPPGAPKTPRSPAARENDALELKVTLVDTPVWRSIVVPACLTVSDLHEVIQVVMGWNDAHLYRFQVRRDAFGDSDGDCDPDQVDLADLELSAGDRFHYLYDFGDCWEHNLVVEKVTPRGTAAPEIPRVLQGVGACPPEDCGGAGRYMWLLEAARSTNRADRAEARNWIPKGFNADHFDLDAANRALHERFE